MYKKMLLLPIFILSIGLSSCFNNEASTDENTITLFEDDKDIYTSILEISIKEEFSSSSSKFNVESFPEVDLSYVANYDNSIEGRKELVVVLKHPTKNNVLESCEKLKNNNYVYSVNTINIPKPEDTDDKNLFNSCYNTIFNKKPEPYLNQICFYSYEKTRDSYSDNFHRFSKEDFPEIEIENISTAFVSTSGKKFVELVLVSLTDKSLENTLNSFLALRHNTLIKSLSFGADGYAI